eukprot:GHUV01000670.1.p1 GENE.GHUV01000670.1~~GHUV01000670.1.p1  ORF type:complete len:233 (+),score=76.41 GHUV01000670.1:150-848(+)
MIATKSVVAIRGLRAPLGAPRPFSGKRQSVVVRFKDNDKPNAAKSDHEQLERELQQVGKGPKDPKLSPDEFEKLRFTQPGEERFYPSSNITPETAEMRADLGKAADVWQWQAFDGPAPETINGRASMFAVVLGLALEWNTGLGLLEQVKDHSITVFASFVIIALASYAPLARGYTRKEPYANHNFGFNWTPKAENWNGRIAMLGFTGMLLTEWIAGVNTLQAWGLQSIPFHH